MLNKAGNIFSLIIEHWKPSRRTLSCWKGGVHSGHFCHCLKFSKADFPHSKIKGNGSISQLSSLSLYIYLPCLDIGICKIDKNKTLDPAITTFLLFLTEKISSGQILHLWAGNKLFFPIPSAEGARHTLPGIIVRWENYLGHVPSLT